jgi:hypothetical protein
VCQRQHLGQRSVHHTAWHVFRGLLLLTHDCVEPQGGAGGVEMVVAEGGIKAVCLHIRLICRQGSSPGAQEHDKKHMVGWGCFAAVACVRACMHAERQQPPQLGQYIS